MFFVVLEINVHYSNTAIVGWKIDIEAFIIKALFCYIDFLVKNIVYFGKKLFDDVSS